MAAPHNDGVPDAPYENAAPAAEQTGAGDDNKSKPSIVPNEAGRKPANADEFDLGKFVEPELIDETDPAKAKEYQQRAAAWAKARAERDGVVLLQGFRFRGDGIGPAVQAVGTAESAPNVSDVTVPGLASCYYAINPSRVPLSLKTSKHHVNEVWRLGVDLDVKAHPDTPKQLDQLADDPALAERLWQHQLKGRRAIVRVIDEYVRRHGKPTTCVDSGGGFQPLFDLDQPVVLPLSPASFNEHDEMLDADGKPTRDSRKCVSTPEREKVIADIEARNQGLFERFNAIIAELGVGHLVKIDGTQDVCRIFRTPWTANRPAMDKRLKARKPAWARLVYDDPAVTYPLSSFPVSKQPVKGKASLSSGDRASVQVDMGNLPRIAPDALETDPVLSKIEQRAKVAIVKGLDEDQPLTGGNTRSDWLWFVACAMVRAGVDDSTMYAIITDPDLKISEHVLTAGNAAAVDRCARRTIQRAREHAIEPWLAALNDEYALVESIGGKTLIVREGVDPVRNVHEIEFLGLDGFRSTYSNQFIQMPKFDKKGDICGEIDVPVGKWWLTHPQRRTYKKLVFAPGMTMPDNVMNIWQGFAVDPKAGDCSLYLNHVRDNICNGNADHYEYVIRWMARMVRMPDRHAEVALVLRGKKGAGKGEFVRHFGHLFGRHYKYVDNPDHITGKFNAVLLDAKVVFADECYVNGDRKHEAGQKALITNPTIRVEPKGIDTLEVRNFVALIMATNASWAVTATEDERRFFVVDVGVAQRKNRAYFEAIDQQMNSGGYAALLHHLLNEVDLSGWDHTNVPTTDALRRQVWLTRPDNDMWTWWCGVLEDGFFECPTWPGKPNRAAAKPLFEAIGAACPRRTDDASQIREFLKARGAHKVQGKGKGGCFWVFPALQHCRRAFTDASGLSPDWTPRTDWGAGEAM